MFTAYYRAMSELAAKDVGLTLEMAETAGVDLGLGPQTLARMRRAIELGHGDEDMAAAWFATRVEPSR